MTKETTTYQSLQQLQSVCLKQNIPFASYRLPLETEITTLVQHQSTPERLDSLQNLDCKSGFVVAPFQETENHGTYILKPDNIFLVNEIKDDYIEKLAQNNRFLSLIKTSDNNIQTTQSTDYINLVEKAKTAMTKGEFHKIVLSKQRLVKLNDDFKPQDFFLKLCEKYPHAFVYMIQLPEVGCWIGATPEPLLIIENEEVKTVSLAGTQIATEAEIDTYLWSWKEIEEQGIVTDYVEQTLRSLGIEKYNKTGPENYQAANLIHLKTSFDFPETELKNQLAEFLKALHPTPSVGGLPKVEACEFILNNEKHDRSYYTGFLGPIHINQKSNIFVNLRCLQLFDTELILYSGAGITASSVAKKEWEETDNKMMTLMNVMQNWKLNN